MTTKYLGITFSDKLLLSPHFRNLKKKFQIPVNIIYHLSGNGRPRVRPKTLLNLYKSILRPSLLYGSQFLYKLSPTNMKSLESLERRLVRRIFGIPYYIRNNLVYDFSKLEPISDYIQRKNIKYMLKILDKPFTQNLLQNLPPFRPGITITYLNQQAQQAVPLPN